MDKPIPILISRERHKREREIDRVGGLPLLTLSLSPCLKSDSQSSDIRPIFLLNEERRLDR